jgi:superfamily II DNA or RNA helicase
MSDQLFPSDPLTSCPLRQGPPTLTFDRGTLLLGEPGSRGDARRLLGPLIDDHELGLVWDPRVSAFRAPADRYVALLRQAREHHVAIKDGCPLPQKISLSAPPLRDYQAAALDAWRIGQRGIVILPTGAGKTRVAIAAIAAVGDATLVLVPTRALLWQWRDELARWYPKKIGVYGDGQRVIEDVTIATFASAYQRLDRFGQRFGLLVVDEVHHFSRGRQSEALEMCTAAQRLGLTATLDADDVAPGAPLARLVGPIVYQEAICTLSGRYLAPYDHIRLPVQLEEDERRRYERARGRFRSAYRAFRRSGGDAAWQAFVVACQHSAAGRQALAGHREAQQIVARAQRKRLLLGRLLVRHATQPTLVFTADNDTAYAVSKQLLAPAITCDIAKKERESIFDDLRQKKINAIVSSRVLNEGIDLPEVGIGVIVGGSQGKREHVQRVGRLLRPGKNKRARVYELVCDGTHEVMHAERRQLALA